MSRIGKKAILLPKGVEINIKDQLINVKGPKGELYQEISSVIEIFKEETEVILRKKENSRQAQQLFGLSRTLLNNLVLGVSEGFSKKLEIIGVGYRSQMQGKDLILNMGYSHPVKIIPPAGITINVEKNTLITISGINKEVVGQVAANIRSVRSPEPYKGKGIRYENEVIKRKVGKAGRGK
uniref:ribosomal protein L6 n=1 Tax=Goniotrichopsis reniformis TaxID=468933 RepID=UPI001FCCF64E|nr:ribosomal protein L6 [Goniotrichopsis reniformis]UNJ14774.1 ribosomal protein L6 [Goniotrichopsis reniformis]